MISLKYRETFSKAFQNTNSHKVHILGLGCILRYAPPPTPCQPYPVYAYH